LVSNISNFIYRTLNFINKNFDDKLTKNPNSNDDKVLAANFLSKFDTVLSYYREYNFREAVKTILEISSLGNKYLQDNEPWKLIKTNKSRCHEVLTFSANIVKNLAILLSPILPNFSVKILKQLGLKNLTFTELNFKLTNHKINTGRIVFTNIEEIPDLESDQFTANLKVATIESVEDHPNADKLYVLKVKLGEETRSLVAGLNEYYSKEDLLNRKIVVVTNLKQAVIRGAKSQGMLLTAERDGKPNLLSAPKASSGDSVFAEGLESTELKIDIDKFYSLGLSVEGKRIFYEDRILKTSKAEIVVDADDGTKIK